MQDPFETVHLTVAETISSRRAQLGNKIAIARLMTDLPPYARSVADRVLMQAVPCEHLEAASRDSATEAAYSFADESDVLLCGGCMSLRARARMNSENDGSACDLCGSTGSAYVVVAGVIVITGSLCEQCDVHWHVPPPREQPGGDASPQDDPRPWDPQGQGHGE